MENWIPELVAATLVGGIGWLLVHKDRAQQTDLDAIKIDVSKLASDHVIDVASLNEMRVRVAESYHLKPEVNEKFKSLEDTMRQGFNDIRADIKQMFAVGIK